ncbi:hypothetical protein HMPREF9374_3081 [Desmospora sp. 8437]|nr:hypothetical protein HMPREF9374_3081 [Desmospora sp. 8437]
MLEEGEAHPKRLQESVDDPFLLVEEFPGIRPKVCLWYRRGEDIR